MGSMNLDVNEILGEIDVITMNKLIGRDEKLQQISDLLKSNIHYYNWVGFYILNQGGKELVLGPYSGADTVHTLIPVGIGVCGQVAQSGETMVVQDVRAMTNYLSCSIDVKSEIVVPITKNSDFVAVLDIDSNFHSPFTPDDSFLLESIAKRLETIF
jgi:L-methionine (R)-S-oxide reductase